MFMILSCLALSIWSPLYVYPLRPAGYDNADWGVTFPALKEEEAEALSPEQAEGALAYFGK